MANLYRAIGRSMAARYVVYAANLLSLMVLTRLFTPEIFGVVAAAQTVVVLFQLVAEGGFTPAIINVVHLSEPDRNGIFGLSLSIGLFAAMIMVLLGPALASFYGMAEIGQIIPYIALAIFANTANVLPLALLQRDQAFFRTARAGLVAELGSLIITFLAHLKLQPLHAYALYFPSKAVLNCACNWYFSARTEFGRPSPGSRFSAVNPLLKTTGFQVAFNFVNYFSRNLDNVLVGKYLGAVPLGIYDRSYQLMRYPLMLLTFAMTPAIQPALRSHINDREYVSRLHSDLAFKLSILGAVCGYGMYFLAKLIVLVAFGSQWLTAIPIIKLLALIVPVQVVLSTSGSFFQAFNRTDLLLRCGICSAMIIISSIVFGIWRGSVETMCWALLFAFHAAFIVTYYVMYKSIFFSGYFSFLRKMIPAAALMTALVLWHIAKN